MVIPPTPWSEKGTSRWSISPREWRLLASLQNSPLTTDSENSLAIRDDDQIDQTGRIRSFSQGGKIGLLFEGFDVGFELRSHTILVGEALSGGLAGRGCYASAPHEPQRLKRNVLALPPHDSR